MDKTVINFRLSELRKAKHITQGELAEREQVVEWLKEMKRLDLSSDDSKRKLVDTFVNSVYLYDDKVVITFNCREGASTLALPLDDTSACMRIGERNILRQSTFLRLRSVLFFCAISVSGIRRVSCASASADSTFNCPERSVHGAGSF